MAVTEVSDEALAQEALQAERRAIVELLTRAYWMEIETVMNYIAASMSQVGAGGLAVTAALTEGVDEEVEHARAIGRRIHELQHGVIPGTEPFAGDDQYPQPAARPADLATMIEAVVAAETSAVRHYQRIIRATAQIDEDTNALVLGILRDEQRHLRRFEGYLREYGESAGADSIG
ncbi:MAG TPA: ferritin-like domain-containing protein [Solirubrobacteraceae bacterium]